MKPRAWLFIVAYMFFGSKAYTQLQIFYDCHSNWYYSGAAQTATFNGSLPNYFRQSLQQKTQGIKGLVQVKVLVDTNGIVCCRSINNHTGKDISSWQLKSLVAAMPAWQPAIHANMKVKFAADINLYLQDTGLLVMYANVNQRYIDYAFTPNKTNNPEIINHKKTKSIWKKWSLRNSMLPGHYPKTIKIDSKGVIWYASVNGIARIEGEQWTIFNSFNTPALKGRPMNTWIANLDIDAHDNVWVASFDELLKYDGKEWTKFENGNKALAFFSNLATAKDGSIWFATPMGLIQFDGRNSTSYTRSNSNIVSDIVRAVYIDKQQAIWLATDSGINKFQNGEWTLYNSKNSPLTIDNISYITGDKQGNIWAGTDDVSRKNILIKIDPGGGVQVFPTAMITDIEIDPKTQHIWLATYGKGLVHFDGKKFFSYTQGNSPFTTSTFEELVIDKNGHKWMGTLQGLEFSTLQ